MGGRPQLPIETIDEVLRLRAAGCSIDVIAGGLGIGDRTVRRIVAGKHALRRPSAEAKPRRTRNQYSDLPATTPEEVRAACAEIQAGWTEVEERRHRGAAYRNPPAEFPVIDDSWLLGPAPAAGE